jgi:hypothetical protein
VMGAPVSGWLLPSKFFFFLFLLLPPWSAALTSGLAPILASRACGVCQERPSAALAHLSARLKSSATSWISCVMSFYNILSSLTPW